jgi:membrane protease YdiL (CAAX protease family)
MSFVEIIDLENLKVFPIAIGLIFGIIYALLSIRILQSPIFETVPLKIEETVRGMNLTVLEGIFISFCAGFGEELLFRTGFQYYLGSWITSFIFVAIHGYFSIRTPKNSLYGLVVFPFILILSYLFEDLGLWFAIAAHFAYDAVLFTSIILKKEINLE